MTIWLIYVSIQLIGIILLEPNRSQLVDRSFVEWEMFSNITTKDWTHLLNIFFFIFRSEQKILKYLLQRYLEIKYQSKSESENRYRKLMNEMREMLSLKHSYDDLYRERPQIIGDAGPLVKEIFDIWLVRSHSPTAKLLNRLTQEHWASLDLITILVQMEYTWFHYRLPREICCH